MRFVLWAIAFAIDLGTPWVTVPHSVRIPPDAAHLPERFGLFTLILLGESVVAVMQGMESQEGWTPIAAGCAFAGIATCFVVWWWYFDRSGATGEQPVRSHRDAVRFHVWSYAHFPLYVGIVVLGAGIQRMVMAAARYIVPATDWVLLSTAILAIGLAMAAIVANTAAATEHPRAQARARLTA